MCGATSLANLVGGEALTGDDIVFDGFTFLDLGSLAVDPKAIDVTASSGTTYVALVFACEPDLVIDDFEFLEILGAVTASFHAPSTRQFKSVSLLLSPNIAGDAFVEAAIDDPFLFTEGANGSSIVFDSTSITPVTSIALDWDVQAEDFDGTSIAILEGFTIFLTPDRLFDPRADLPDQGRSFNKCKLKEKRHGMDDTHRSIDRGQPRALRHFRRHTRPRAGVHARRDPHVRRTLRAEELDND